MGFPILSGTGNGKEAAVDDNNRLCGNNLTEDLGSHASNSGNRYNINTGSVELTNAAESAVFYFKNNENSDYIINAIIYNLGASASGVGETAVDVHFNPTSGTIISNATAADIVVNQNLGSSNSLAADVFKGVQGATQAGGVIAISSLISPGSRAALGLGKIVVPKGKSLSVTMTPPTSNTSMDVQVAISGYLAAPIVTGGAG